MHRTRTYNMMTNYEWKTSEDGRKLTKWDSMLEALGDNKLKPLFESSIFQKERQEIIFQEKHFKSELQNPECLKPVPICAHGF